MLDPRDERGHLRTRPCDELPDRVKPRALRSLAVAISLVAAPASAAIRCAPIAGAVGRLATIDVETRLEFLRLHFRHDAARARIWAWSWAGVYSGLVSYNAIRLGLAANHDERIDDSVGVAGSMVGVIALAALPQKVMGDQQRFDRLLAAAPHSPGDGDRCLLLAEGEQMLLRDAESEAFGHGPLIHIGNVAFNLGLGLLLGLGFNHWSQAAIVMLSGIAVGELQTLTSPADVGETLALYRAGHLDGARQLEPAAMRWTVSASATPNGASFMIGFSFP